MKFFCGIHLFSILGIITSLKLSNKSLVKYFLHTFKITIWFPQRLQYAAMRSVKALKMRTCRKESSWISDLSKVLS